jgi:hypothetical protein
MRKAGLAVALVATTQLTLLSSLSSTAFADGSISDRPPVNLSGTTTSTTPSSPAATPAAAPAPTPAPAEPEKDSKKITTGWVLIGAGSAVGIAGIIINIVGANSGTVAGQGGQGDATTTDNTRFNLYFAGTTLIVAGLAAGIYGGALVWSGNNGGDAKASEHKDDDAKADGITKVAEAKFASAPSFVLPIVGATF